jgi:LacI family transcriptional regulator, repressor for deo operon, udp, cdd, tsx, nupC, and nupG
VDDRLPRIQDVAREAGVSTATVSRALSQPEKVAEATREAVMNAVRKTGYRVHLAARNLRRGRTGIIVALVPNLGNPFFSAILAGIESVASQAGFGVLVADTTQPDFSRDSLTDFLRADRADGLVVLDGTLSRLLAPSIDEGGAHPPVVFACEWTEGTHYPSVIIDNRLGGRLAVEHLADLGHQAIGHVSGPAKNVLTAARREGARDALTSRGLPFRAEWFLPGDFTLQSGIEAARAWHDLAERPTAMFCASDQMAFGFISELHRNGFSVPSDVSVVGFDDIDISACYIPALTTMRQPRLEIGMIAAEKLIEQILSPSAQAEYNEEKLPVELIRRESSAPPAAH